MWATTLIIYVSPEYAWVESYSMPTGGNFYKKFAVFGGFKGNGGLESHGSQLE